MVVLKLGKNSAHEHPADIAGPLPGKSSATDCKCFARKTLPPGGKSPGEGGEGKKKGKERGKGERKCVT